MGLLLWLKRKSMGAQRLAQLRNPDTRLAVIVFDALHFCCHHDGVPFNEELHDKALCEADKYPNITITEFLDGLKHSHLQRNLRTK